MLAILAFLLMTGISSACQSKVKLLKNQPIKKVEASIEKLGADGYVPMEALISGKGKRTKFDVRFNIPKEEIQWFVDFELTDEEFSKLFEEKKQAGYRVAWHEKYSIKREQFHACIWHSDGSYQPPTKEELLDSENKPPATPIGTVWKPVTRIPAHSQAPVAFAKLESDIVAYMRANQMPALSTAVAIKGEVVYEGSYGYSNLETRLPIEAGQPIRTSSLSKLITAVAILRLVDRGRLKLDQPVYPLLGVDPMKQEAVDARTSNITVLHLLQDTGGHDNRAVIEPGFQPRYLEAVFKQKGTMVTPTQAISYMMSQPLAFNPGERRFDSSWGYFLLARVVEKVSGMSYEDFVLKQIAKPLRMKSLTMSRTDPDKRTANEVKSVFRRGGWHRKLTGAEVGKWVQLNSGGYHFGLLDGSQGWMATAGDMLRLGLAIQANPSPILSDQAKLVLVSKPDYVLAMEKQERKPKVLWKGCSLFCQETKGGITLSLDAAEASGSASLVLHSARDVAFCYIFNCANTAAGQHPKAGFDPIIRNESYRLHDLLNRQ